MTPHERAISAVDSVWSRPVPNGKSAHTAFVDAVEAAVRAAEIAERAACAKVAIGAGKDADLSDDDARHLGARIMDRSRFDD